LHLIIVVEWHGHGMLCMNLPLRFFLKF
jgi:hypothetical protein